MSEYSCLKCYSLSYTIELCASWGLSEHWLLTIYLFVVAPVRALSLLTSMTCMVLMLVKTGQQVLRANKSTGRQVLRGKKQRGSIEVLIRRLTRVLLLRAFNSNFYQIFQLPSKLPLSYYTLQISSQDELSFVLRWNVHLLPSGS